jgi:hypothetical protein
MVETIGSHTKSKSESLKKTAKKVKPALSSEIQTRLNKAIDRITNPRPKAIEFKYGTSIARRLAKAQSLVTLIASASCEDSDVSAAEVLEAVNELYW